MVADDSFTIGVPNKMHNSPPQLPLARRAAQYVRMSTEHQQYSTENQADKILDYAAHHGFEIVRTYADEGKSGLSIGGRDGLQRLLADVKAGNTDFEAVLVYDVSRWGRFQDADESAHYEYTCKQAGILVIYCAEQFENDGSPVSTIVKGVKRAMAGEYSRELSAKVFAGQCRLIELGFRQGGPAGFGLRRVLLDQSGETKAALKTGEQKSLQTDRVVLRPGPPEEVEIVHQIYRWFVEDGLSEGPIVAELNRRGIMTDLGRPWTRGTVHEVLTNEKYIGHNIYNRRSFKLKRRHVVNPPDLWIRKDHAFDPIVPPDLFYMAQGIVRARTRRYSDQELLDRLRALYQAKGFLSGILNRGQSPPQTRATPQAFAASFTALAIGKNSGQSQRTSPSTVGARSTAWPVRCRLSMVRLAPDFTSCAWRSRVRTPSTTMNGTCWRAASTTATRSGCTPARRALSRAVIIRWHPGRGAGCRAGRRCRCRPG